MTVSADCQKLSMVIVPPKPSSAWSQRIGHGIRLHVVHVLALACFAVVCGRGEEFHAVEVFSGRVSAALVAYSPTVLG